MVENAFKSAINTTAPPAEAKTPAKFAVRHVLVEYLTSHAVFKVQSSKFAL
jgi:hypothetical protein